MPGQVSLASQSAVVEGRVKWFNPDLGYGFIVPKDGGSDVLLHADILKNGGHPAPQEGCTFVCEILVDKTRGARAVCIVDADYSTAIQRQGESTNFRTLLSPQKLKEEGFVMAAVKWFDSVRGFGFVTRGEGTDDIFVHKVTLKEAGTSCVEPGQNLWVRFTSGDKGLYVAEVRL